jgi:DNA-binding SARP family transcriptional activator
MGKFAAPGGRAAAGNSLNVAVHGLRRAFRASAEVPVVVLEDGAYRLGPRLRLWLDVDEFERPGGRGRRVRAGAPLYQGDPLADDPYEEWPVTAREHLLLAYLDVLDRLGSLAFDQGQPHLALRQYQACADALDRELGVDPDPATVALAQRIRRHEPV